jgi:hypothetical protein
LDAEELCSSVLSDSLLGFRHGIDDVGHVALFLARQLGVKSHKGSFAHRMLSGILGLRNKLRLTGILKGRRVFGSSSGTANRSMK